MLKDKLKENEVSITARLTPDLNRAVLNAVQDYPMIYGSKTHFVRVAVIRELRRINQEGV